MPLRIAPSQEEGPGREPDPRLQRSPCTSHPETSACRALPASSRWSSPGAEARTHACPCLRHRCMNTAEACRELSLAGRDQRWSEPMWVRHQTACSVDKSSCRPLRNDSSLIPRWGVCLLPSQRKREGGTCLSPFLSFPHVTSPVARKEENDGGDHGQLQRGLGSSAAGVAGRRQTCRHSLLTSA